MPARVSRDFSRLAGSIIRDRARRAQVEIRLVGEVEEDTMEHILSALADLRLPVRLVEGSSFAKRGNALVAAAALTCEKFQWGGVMEVARLIFLSWTVHDGP